MEGPDAPRIRWDITVMTTPIMIRITTPRKITRTCMARIVLVVMETQIAMNDSPRPPLSVGPVAGDQAGTRLDKWLAGAVADLSRERLKALIKQGRVRADGETITDPSYGVKPGQRFDVDVPEPISPIPKPQEIPLVIAYEDEAVIVVNKPAGLVRGGDFRDPFDQRQIT